MPMEAIKNDSKFDLTLNLNWSSNESEHLEVYRATGVNMWRDWLPPVLKKSLNGAKEGDRIEVTTGNGLSAYFDHSGEPVQIKNSQFNRRLSGNGNLRPRIGRFYPKGILTSMPGIFSANLEPFRCVGKNNGHLKVDLNHPLAGREFALSATVGKITSKQSERGGESIDWLGVLGTGPGMQARWNSLPTDYSTENPFDRENPDVDSAFYSRPRFTHHLDYRAREAVRALYGRHLTDGMKVLDLMSSWQSHVPETVHFHRLAGVGLNLEELQRNRLLSDHLVHDLNEDPHLPFADASFDAALCTVSVEYLTDPIALFNEVARILRPGGTFLVTFSNRWFPPKVVKVWKELHEFERIGLVIDYFLSTGQYMDIKSYSLRGLPRPATDKYADRYKLSDPVYSVWARKVG